jgi:DNA (cytosine-5)-methyltransferase 1
MEGFVESASGLLVPEEFAIDEVRQRKRRTGVDLFAGCGGCSLGMMTAGIEILAMVEWDPYAVMTYSTNLCRWGEMQFHFLTPEDEKRMELALQKEWKRKSKRVFEPYGQPLAGQGWISNHPEVPGVKHVIVGDIRRLTGKQLLEWIGLEVGELGCIVGSPPCQGFSRANSKAHDNDPRNDYCFEMARLVVETMPLTMVLENVPPFAKSPKFVRFLEILKEGGFHGVEALEQFCSKKAGRVAAHRHSRSVEKEEKPKPKPKKRAREVQQLELGVAA